MLPLNVCLCSGQHWLVYAGHGVWDDCQEADWEAEAAVVEMRRHGRVGVDKRRPIAHRKCQFHRASFYRAVYWHWTVACILCASSQRVFCRRPKTLHFSRSFLDFPCFLCHCVVIGTFNHLRYLLLRNCDYWQCYVLGQLSPCSGTMVFSFLFKNKGMCTFHETLSTLSFISFFNWNILIEGMM